MITASHISTESSELPIEEMLREKENLEQVSSVEVLKTSSESQPITIAPKSSLAYHPFFHMIFQRLASGEEMGYKELSHIKFIKFLNSMDIYRLETLSSYPTLELGALERLYTPQKRSEVIRIAEENVIQLLHKDMHLTEVLSSFVNEIEEYFETINKPHKIGVILQEDPEDPEFKAFVILINTKFDNLKEKLKLEREVGHLLNSLRYKLVESEGREVLAKIERITYLVDSLG